MKLRGSGPGPIALLTEFLALTAAKSMGLAVPAARPLYLRPNFPWTIGTDEFDGIIQRSFGWNLGISYFGAATIAQPRDIQSADPCFLDALADVDRALCNMDRSKSNPNILVAQEGLIAIDFDACLFVRRANRQVIPSGFPLPDGHLLSERPIPAPHRRLDGSLLAKAVREAPRDWTSASVENLDQLEQSLAAYAAAWNAQ